MKRVTKELREKVKKAGQEHLFKFLDAGKLSKSEVIRCVFCYRFSLGLLPNCIGIPAGVPTGRLRL